MPKPCSVPRLWPRCGTREEVTPESTRGHPSPRRQDPRAPPCTASFDVEPPPPVFLLALSSHPRLSTAQQAAKAGASAPPFKSRSISPPLLLQSCSLSLFAPRTRPDRARRSNGVIKSIHERPLHQEQLPGRHQWPRSLLNVLDRLALGPLYRTSATSKCLPEHGCERERLEGRKHWW